MKKSHALILALLITILIAVNFFLISPSFSPQRERVVIARVIDGDTLKLEDGRTIRLLNINTPEKGKAGYQVALEFLKKYENKSAEIEIIGGDKYQRVLARIYAPEYLNFVLVEEGLSSKFLVDESEIGIFAKTEREAIAQGKGIWEKSEHFGCLEGKVDAENEIVVLESKCNNINIEGWTLKDESRKTYTFTVGNVKRVILHSEEGDDNGQDIFWDSKTHIWNNDRDSIYIFDKESKIVYYDDYGY